PTFGDLAGRTGGDALRGGRGGPRRPGWNHSFAALARPRIVAQMDRKPSGRGNQDGAAACFALRRPARRDPNYRDRQIVLKVPQNPAAGAWGMWRGSGVGRAVIGVPPSGGEDRLRSGDELGQLAQVVGDGGEVEFVAGATRAASP